MSSCNSLKIVFHNELLGDVLAEGVACTAGGYAPAASVVGIGPEEVAHGSFVRHFDYAIDSFDLVEGVEAGGEATVEAEDLVFNHCA